MKHSLKYIFIYNIYCVTEAESIPFMFCEFTNFNLHNVSYQISLFNINIGNVCKHQNYLKNVD